jgi:hypothetical protein
MKQQEHTSSFFFCEGTYLKLHAQPARRRHEEAPHLDGRHSSKNQQTAAPGKIRQARRAAASHERSTSKIAGTNRENGQTPGDRTDPEEKKPHICDPQLRTETGPATHRQSVTALIYLRYKL